MLARAVGFALLLVLPALAGCVTEPPRSDASAPAERRAPFPTLPPMVVPNLTLERFVPPLPLRNATIEHLFEGAVTFGACPPRTVGTSTRVLPVEAAPGPHDAAFEGRPPCVEYEGATRASAAAFSFRPRTFGPSFPGASGLALHGVVGAWHGADGTNRSLDAAIVRLEGAVTAAAPVTARLDGAVVFNGTSLASARFVNPLLRIPTGAPQPALPLRLDLHETVRLENVTSSEWGNGTLVVERLRGADWAHGVLALATGSFAANATGVRTRGADGGWTLAGKAVPGDVAIEGNATVDAVGGYVVVHARAAQAWAGETPLFATRLDARDANHTRTVLPARVGEGAVAWIEVRETSLNALAPGVRLRVVAADERLRLGVGQWWDDPDATLLSAAELFARGLITLFTFGLADDAFGTAHIPAGAARYAPVTVNATAAGDYAIDLVAEGPSGAPAPIRLLVRVES